MTQQQQLFQILHGNLQAHIYNRRGRRSRAIAVVTMVGADVPPVDLAALVQLTAWVERLDAIMRTNDGEDKVILNIRTRAVGVLDSWVGRWELRQRVQE